MTRCRVVIVGAGAGGLPLATWLGRQRSRAYEVVLVDRFPTHVWKPLLHELAVGTLASNEDEVNLFAHGQHYGYEFILGEMRGLERGSKRIHLGPVLDESGQEILPARDQSYDLLVLAVGSQSNDFGVPGVSRYALFLDDTDGAEHFHRVFVHALLRNDFLMRAPSSHLDMVIVGAGATGVELAALMQELLSQLGSFGLRNFDRQRARIILLEAGDRCVPALKESVGIRVQRDLEAMGIEVRLGTRVESISEAEVRIHNSPPIPTRFVVWCAGTKAHDWLASLNLPGDKQGRLKAKPTLQSVTDPSIFLLGDCASVTDEEGGIVPMLAQAAFQQAAYLRRALPELLERGAISSTFHFRNRGSLVSLASEDTVGTIMGRYIHNLGVHGAIARIAYLWLYRRHQFAILGVRNTLLALLKNSLSTIPGNRLKLH